MLVLNPLASKAGTSPFITEGKRNGVIYASGGVGLDEQMEMDAMAKNYNVKMVFVEAPRDYVSGVEVKIEDHSGKVLLEATSSGPWFFAKLPRGEYRLIASFHHHQEMKNLNVASGHETVEFFWKA
jgi:tripartite-type tricarboxylate transporter receptor subunit TctC